jgi:hypothetical protein
MTTIVISVILGLLVNECCDVSPWCARKLVQWSAHRRYTDPDRAGQRAEELSALIDGRPGKLLKLFSALGFAGSAVLVVFRREFARRLDTIREKLPKQGREAVEALPRLRDVEAVQALFERSPYEFEQWVRSQITGPLITKRAKDGGIDGAVPFPSGRTISGMVLLSVKGGRNISPAFVRDLIGAVEAQRAQMGILVTLASPTKNVIDAATHSGVWTHPVTGKTFPRVQVISVADLLAGRRPCVSQLIASPRALWDRER